MVRIITEAAFSKFFKHCIKTVPGFGCVDHREYLPEIIEAELHLSPTNVEHITKIINTSVPELKFPFVPESDREKIK